MKTSELDTMFDEGKDITSFLDLSHARRINVEAKRVNVAFPAWMVSSLDEEARNIGVTRQAIIKLWLAERLENRQTTSDNSKFR